MGRSYHKYIYIFSLTSFIWIYVFIAAIHSSLPPNPIQSIPIFTELKINTWFTQSWGFYSKNPREDYFIILNLKDGKSAVEWPHNKVKNLFGVKRFGRSQGIEAGLLSNLIPKSKFTSCKEDPKTCFNKTKVTMEIDNPSPKPSICGDIGFIYQEPVPWAWSKSSKIEMPSKIVRVKVNCLIK